MTETTTPNEDLAMDAKSHFAKAIDEARAGAQALADGYRGKFSQAAEEWTSEAKARSEEAREKADAFSERARRKAADMANEGKAMTSQTLATLAKMIDDNVGTIDEKAGATYGDYARTASKSLRETAVSLDEKSLEQLGEDAKEFVRNSPALAVGVAVAAGFLIGRIFKKGD